MWIIYRLPGTWGDRTLPIAGKELWTFPIELVQASLVTSEPSKCFHYLPVMCQSEHVCPHSPSDNVTPPASVFSLNKPGESLPSTVAFTVFHYLSPFDAPLSSFTVSVATSQLKDNGGLVSAVCDRYAHDTQSTNYVCSTDLYAPTVMYKNKTYSPPLLSLLLFIISATWIKHSKCVSEATVHFKRT